MKNTNIIEKRKNSSTQPATIITITTSTPSYLHISHILHLIHKYIFPLIHKFFGQRKTFVKITTKNCLMLYDVNEKIWWTLNKKASKTTNEEKWIPCFEKRKSILLIVSKKGSLKKKYFLTAKKKHFFVKRRWKKGNSSSFKEICP